MSSKLWLGMSCVVAGAALGLTQACGSGASGSSPVDSGADVTADRNAPGDTGTGDAVAADGGVSDASAVDALAVHPPFPQVPNTTGKTMSAPTLITILASNDAPTDGSDTVSSLQAFSGAMAVSAVWAGVANEYHVGALTPGAQLIGPAMAAGSYTTAQLQAYVGSVIGADAGPSPGGNFIYLLYLPTGADFAGADANDCGYHMPYPTRANSTGDQVAAVRRCTPQYGEPQLGSLTRTASHEIVESATDPLDEGYNIGLIAPQPWQATAWLGTESDSHIELGDLCLGTHMYEALDGGPDGGWELQRMWSNAAAATGGDPCAPPYGEPYVSVFAPQQWYAGAAGATVTIPLTGWSVAPASNWLLRPEIGTSTAVFASILDTDGGGVAASGGLGNGAASGCVAHVALNDGTSATLSVTVPTAAQSGDYAVFLLESKRGDPSAAYPATCYPPTTEDYYHFWPVGLYVP